VSAWTAEGMPSQAGKVVVVTGANSGLGYEVARAMSAKGARIVLACRNVPSGEAAADRLRAEIPGAELDVLRLDLADLSSVRAFASAFGERHSKLDALCNNAGVMAVPHRGTSDGFEMQIGTNHLGHFALTGVLLPHLRNAPRARVVTVTSNVHKIGRIRLDDLQSERSYRPWRAYAQSKLANLMFALELERRFERDGVDAISVAAHPGYANTNLQIAGPGGDASRLVKGFWRMANRVAAQSAAMGALPLLYAMTEPSVRGGDFVGPQSMFELYGQPGPVKPVKRANDVEVASKLWDLSEQLTSVRYLSPAT
jgi:NAD(P)-dependent dehydrogenase (short-subunit alcohol dehydrogenase family)